MSHTHRIEMTVLIEMTEMDGTAEQSAKIALDQLTAAATEAMYNTPDVQVTSIVDLGTTSLITKLMSERAELARTLSENGGRGVDIANRIDDLDTRIETLSLQSAVTRSPQHTEFLADVFDIAIPGIADWATIDADRSTSNGRVTQVLDTGAKITLEDTDLIDEDDLGARILTLRTVQAGLEAIIRTGEFDDTFDQDDRDEVLSGMDHSDADGISPTLAAKIIEFGMFGEVKYTA